MWCYLLSYDPTEVRPQVLLPQIDRLTVIKNWVAPYAGAVLLISPVGAKRLSLIFQRRTALRGSFVLVDTDSDIDGFLPEDLWDWVNEPDEFVEYDDEDF